MARRLGEVKLFVGFDPREALAYHVFCQSVIKHASIPVSFHPLSAKMLGGWAETDGTNAFTLSRFLVPWLCDFQGWAIYADGDMTMECDIKELWQQKDLFAFDTACAVVKHNYMTRHIVKYRGSAMEAPNYHYEMKNWSSLILWNCAHFGNRTLEPMFVDAKGGKFLHRFKWLEPKQVGFLPFEWNHLVGEEKNDKPKLRHYTLGVPGIAAYSKLEANTWHNTFLDLLACAGEPPLALLGRSINTPES